MFSLLLLTFSAISFQETIDLAYLCQKVIEHDRQWMNLQGEWTMTTVQSQSSPPANLEPNFRYSLRVNGTSFIQTREILSGEQKGQKSALLVNDRYVASLFSLGDGKWQSISATSRLHDYSKVQANLGLGPDIQGWSKHCYQERIGPAFGFLASDYLARFRKFLGFNKIKREGQTLYRLYVNMKQPQDYFSETYNYSSITSTRFEFILEPNKDYQWIEAKFESEYPIDTRVQARAPLDTEVTVKSTQVAVSHLKREFKRDKDQWIQTKLTEHHKGAENYEFTAEIKSDLRVMPYLPLDEISLEQFGLKEPEFEDPKVLESRLRDQNVAVPVVDNKAHQLFWSRFWIGMCLTALVLFFAVVVFLRWLFRHRTAI